WEFVSTMLKHHRLMLRKLAQIDIDIEKLTNTSKWRAGRIALARFRIMRGPQPKPPIPSNWPRSSKIGHWLKDHHARIEARLMDRVCRAANGFPDARPSEDDAAAFNAHIAPIAKTYGFKLDMGFEEGNPVLRGDISKAVSVPLYLCSAERTPEIDWMLDMVTMFMVEPPTPLQVKKSWQTRLRHTKLGMWWRKQREHRKQKQAIEAPKERQRLLEQHALYAVINEDRDRHPRRDGSRRVKSPTMSHQEGDHADHKRLL